MNESAPLVRIVSLDAVDTLIDELLVHAAGRIERCVLGVTGPPGAGKSTFAERVVTASQGTVAACVAPMDGFHRCNQELESMGLSSVKGIPDSFDAASFIVHLTRLRRGNEPVTWPVYDRKAEEVAQQGTEIDEGVRLVVVEGNYLLMETQPWRQVRPLLDEVWYLDAPDQVLIPRLVSRHERHRTPADALAKIRSTDLPNARLVEATRHLADVIIGYV